MTTVLCHGVFDVLHIGHLDYLEQAFKLARDCRPGVVKLVVSVTADEFVREAKGPDRPFFTQDQRMRLVRALWPVNRVVLSNAADATAVIGRVRPHFYVKGPDYADFERLDFATFARLQLELEELRLHGGQFLTTTRQTHSSSQLAQQLLGETSCESKTTLLTSGLPLFDWAESAASKHCLATSEQTSKPSCSESASKTSIAMCDRKD